ncbi:hypothetical protein LMIY3S_02329 [Labrys miyagiensis]
MPGNWNPYQNINFSTAHVEWPTGPLKLDPNWRPVWVEAWVVQTASGATQRTAQWTGWPNNFAVWTADGIPPGWINGKFQPGPALGIALLASHNDVTGEDDSYWWLDVVTLY